MCSRYRAYLKDLAKSSFQAPWRKPPAAEPKADVFPGYSAPFVRRPPELSSGDEAVPAREACLGRFGLFPHWVKDEKLCKSTYNARSETVASKPAFRDAWRKAQHCIIPAEAFYEPDWRTSKHIPTRISRADGQALGIAGLWSWCPLGGADGTLSFTMLTINAQSHKLMCNYHRPDDEKRMIVLLREDDFDAWLDAPADRSMDFMRQCPPEDLQAVGEPQVPA